MSDFFLGTSAVLLFLLSLFLVFIIMIQRGKGGGIAGSLTGTAQSAFGARGGDLLMWVTIGLTGVWILLSGITIFFYSSPSDSPELEEKGGVIETRYGYSTEANEQRKVPGRTAKPFVMEVGFHCIDFALSEHPVEDQDFGHLGFSELVVGVAAPNCD